LPTPARYLLRALGVVVGLALLLVLLFNAALIYLRTPAGTARLLAIGLGAANEAITGHIDAQNVTIRGSHVLIQGAHLVDSEGTLVASIEKADVDIVFPALLLGHIEARNVQLSGPVFSVVLDEDGSNLDRAFAPKHPDPGAPPVRPPPITFIVHHLDIEQGRVEVKTPEGPPFLLQGLALAGDGRYVLRSQDFQLNVQGNGGVDKPTPGPISLLFQGELRGRQLSLSADVHLAGGNLVGDVKNGPEGLDGHFALDVDPSLARALVRSWPLRVPLALSAEARHSGAGYSLSGDAALGRARVELRGDVNLEAPAAQKVRVSVQHLDFAELLGRGPKSDLGLTLDGEGNGTSWSTAKGSLRLSVPPSRIRGAEVGPVAVVARLEAGRLDVSSFRAQLPGLQLTGAGEGTARALEATLHLEVTDLSALGRTLGDVVSLPPLSGQGALQVELMGHPTHPGGHVEGHFATVSLGAFFAQGLELSVKLPDVARPLDANATLAFGRLSLAGRSLKDVHATLVSEGRGVQLQVTAASGVHVALAGTADADARGLLLDTLLLEFPDARWALKAPAALRFDEKHLSAERLELVSGAQSLAFEGGVSAGHVQASLEVAHLDLGHLPSVLVPPSTRLSGILDAAASAHGAEGHPDVTLKVDVAGGSWHGLTDVTVHADAGRTENRLTLGAHVAALGSTLDVEAEAPESLLGHRVHQPVALHLSAQGVDVGLALCDLARAGFFLEGCPAGAALALAHVGLEATVGGFADGPSVHLTLHAADLRLKGLPPVDATLGVEADEGSPVGLKLSATGLEGTLEVQASLKATTGQLLARRPTFEGWRTLPVDIALKAAGLKLALLQETGYLPRTVQGTLGAVASLTGTLAAPKGQAEVDVENLVLPPWPGGQAHFSLTAENTLDARLTLTSAKGEKGMVHLTVGAPLSELLLRTDPEKLARAAVLLEGDVGPFELRDLPLDANRLRRDRQLLDGQFRLTFDGRGTLLAPVVTATALANSLGPKDGAHFEGTAKFHSAEGRQTLQVKLSSASGGALDLDAETALDLSLPGLRHGLHPGAAPLKATLHSVRFEPDFVASFIPAMRSISGKLEVDGKAQGTLGQPDVEGSISWTNGAIGIIGFGLYQDIQLKASASNARFAIEQLSARVQSGTLSLQLKGERGAEGFAVSGALHTQDLPVVLDDQLWCTATLQADLGGTARPWELDLSRINLSQVELQIPEARRKDLQPLNAPQDVILTRHGVPVDTRQAARAIGLDPRHRGLAAGTQAAPKSYFLKLSLEAPNHIAVRGKDVTLELGLSKPFQVDLGEQVSIEGEVRILRGRGDVWGRRFEVQPGGQVRFLGPPQEAQLDVTGVYTSVQSQAKVYMHLSGAVTNVRVTPSSDPPLGESEIYTLLATGRTTLAQSSVGSSTAVGGDAGASIVGSWAATQLKKAVGVALPIDVLSVEVGNDERVGNQTRLEAGKYLTDDIYIGYQGRTNADPFRYQNSNAVRVEYRFLRRWSLQLEYGDANAGSLDAVWSRDY
jgi:translocation and assembly module TamB